jgi:hypothetical protein
LFFMRVLLLIIAIMLLSPINVAESQKDFDSKKACCDYWTYILLEDRNQKGWERIKQYQVNSTYLRDDEKSIMCGIECLLKMQGNRRKSQSSANISLAWSSRLPNPTFEVAALYYISSIYGCAGNIGAILLYDENCNRNTPRTIKKAYQYYREWFAEVKRIGISEARQLRIEPLKNKRDVQWSYGDTKDMPLGYFPDDHKEQSVP